MVSSTGVRFKSIPLLATNGGLLTRSRTCDYGAVKLRDLLARSLAILLIGSLICSPLAVSAAGTDAIADNQATSHEMAMDSMAGVADEMPCHQQSPDNGKACPFMAICMMLCCQGTAAYDVSLASPAPTAARVLPPELIELYGITSPPPSRPPNA